MLKVSYVNSRALWCVQQVPGSDEHSRVKGHKELGFFQVLEVPGQATGFRGCDKTPAEGLTRHQWCITLWHVWHNRGGGPKWWVLGWVIDITTQSQEGPLLSSDSLNETFYRHSRYLWQWWFIMFLHVLYLSLALLAFQHTGYSASYMPFSLFRCVHKKK